MKSIPWILVGKLEKTKDGIIWEKMLLLDKWEFYLEMFQKVNNYQHLISKKVKMYLTVLIQEPNGQNANQLEKLEIKQIVDHVGLSEQLKLWVIEHVLQVNKWNKIEFLQKIWIVVVKLVEWDVTVVILLLLGVGGKEQVL